ncbi:MAG: ribonuclease R [Microvirga sp.]|nr:ribonuclease R [Microvirga sp.]
MPRRQKPAPGEGSPSREQIVDFIRSQPGRVGKREIARAFGLSGADKIALKHLLKELEEEGLVERRKRDVVAKGELPPVVVADMIERDDDGELIAVPAEWDEADDSAPPRILVTTPRRPKPGQPAPGVNDRALLRVERSEDPDGPPYVGRVIKLIEKQRTLALGVFRPIPTGGGRLVPVDKKSLGREIGIAPGDEGGAQDGDLVSVTMTPTKRFGLPMAKVRERLGSLKTEKAVSLVALHAHAIPHVFPQRVIAESEAAAPASMKGREDWRALPLLTIDPADAKDHDDAVHALADDDPANEGGFVVTVAIADVAAYIRPGSALDREALERGNSVYFPDRVVPMLPERISNDLCSLRPHEDRPALAVRLVIGANGAKKRHSFHRIMMRSAARLSYQQAQAAIDGRPDEVTGPLLDDVLTPLWAAYRCVSQARDERGPLALDLPERKILLTADGTVDQVIVPERLDAHRLIEEFMILANVSAAEALEKAKVPLIYRAHDEPSLTKMHALGEVLASIAMKLPKQGALRPSIFNRILKAVEGMEHQTFINEVVLRTQAQAEYTSENYGHFGLNLRRYAHFTSPIRRYADLIVHRALITAHGLGSDGLPKDVTREELAEISARISAAERRAMAAERETIDRLIAHHLADRVGATFEGQISGVTKSGLFVKLDHTGADGYVPAATIGDDYFRYEEYAHALVGDRTGVVYRLGDRVTVKLIEAAPVAGALRFEMLSEGRTGGGALPRAGRRGKGSGIAKKGRAKSGAAIHARRKGGKGRR